MYRYVEDLLTYLDVSKTVVWLQVNLGAFLRLGFAMEV
jgi:hypothetical protein